MCSTKRGCAVRGEGVQYEKRVCNTRRVPSAVTGESVQYEEMMCSEVCSAKRGVCSAMRVTPSPLTAHSLYKMIWFP